MSTVISPAQARRELSGFQGRLIGPDDIDYDEARKVYNGMIDKRPALIARCATVEDISRVVGFAREHDLRSRSAAAATTAAASAPSRAAS